MWSLSLAVLEHAAAATAWAPLSLHIERAGSHLSISLDLPMLNYSMLGF